MPQLRYNCRESDATDMRPFLSSSVVILVLGSEAVCAYRNFGPTNVFWRKPIYDGFTNQVPPARYKTRTDTRSKSPTCHVRVCCAGKAASFLRVRDIHLSRRPASPRVGNLQNSRRRRRRRRQYMFPYVVVSNQERPYDGILWDCPRVPGDHIWVPSTHVYSQRLSCLSSSLQMPAILRTATTIANSTIDMYQPLDQQRCHPIWS